MVPQPNRFAHEMREYFEQQIPLIGKLSCCQCTPEVPVHLSVALITCPLKILLSSIRCRLLSFPCVSWCVCMHAGFQHGFDFLEAFALEGSQLHRAGVQDPHPHPGMVMRSTMRSLCLGS